MAAGLRAAGQFFKTVDNRSCMHNASCMAKATTFAERLKLAREARGYTRNALSERANLSRNLVLHLEENSEASPKLTTVGKLAAALEVDEAWLATGAGRPPKARVGKRKAA